VENTNGPAAPRQFCSHSRRRFLLASVSTAFLAACQRSSPTAALPPRAAEGTDANAGPHSALEQQFLALSSALTGKDDLDPVTSRRILEALARLEPATFAALPALVELSRAGHTQQAILDRAGEAKTAALAIVACWYTGTVGKGTQAVTVAFRDALMQRPVADGLFPQTYAMGGPGWWSAPAPSEHAMAAH